MIAIVTDSSVGYSTAEIADRGIVSVVPLNYNVGGNNFEEKASDKNGALMPAIESAPCKTAQPALASFIQTFSSLVAKGCDVICIVLSSSLSGTYSSAKFAAGQVGGNIRVIDSRTIGAGMHLLVDEAVNLVKAGVSFERAVEMLEELKNKIGIVFTVETLDNLIAGGRLNTTKAKTSLNNRPVFDLKAKIIFKSNARGARERLEEMLAEIPENTRRIIVCRCGENTDVSALTALLRTRYPSVYIHQRVLGPVHSIHVGEGAFGVAYVVKNQ